MMKNNKVITYALIISIVIHSALILFLLKYDNKKIKKHHTYSKPIMIEPYTFAKNLKKFKVHKPKYAGIKPHHALKNTRLRTPPSYGSNVYTSHRAARPAFKRKLANNHKRRILSSSHLFSKVLHIQRRQNPKLSSIYPIPMETKNQGFQSRKSIMQNPLHGIKSATVNLNTTTIKYASYLLHVKNKIENVWEYPTKAKNEGISGRLVIEFSINSDGSIYKVRILRHSIRKSLDIAAVNAIKNAAKYNPLPKSWAIKRLNIIGTFIYRLSNFYLY